MLRFPPKKILVGIDLSGPSLAAWRHAAAWTEKFGAQLRAVHSRGPEPLDIPAVPRLPGGAAAIAEDLREEFRRRTGAPGLDVQEGDPAVTLLRIARQWRADLLVVGTHGRTGVPRLLLGSVSERLLRESPIPVLAVHEDPAPLRSVLAPVNFTGYADQAFRYGADVAAAFGAQLVAHHVAGLGRALEKTRLRLEREILSLPPQVRRACMPRVALSEGAPSEAIARAAGSHDLIVLSAHRKGFLHDLMVGTTAQQVLRTARKPLLAVPAAPELTRLHGAARGDIV